MGKNPEKAAFSSSSRWQLWVRRSTTSLCPTLCLLLQSACNHSAWTPPTTERESGRVGGGCTGRSAQQGVVFLALILTRTWMKPKPSVCNRRYCAYLSRVDELWIKKGVGGVRRDTAHYASIIPRFLMSSLVSHLSYPSRDVGKNQKPPA